MIGIAAVYLAWIFYAILKLQKNMLKIPSLFKMYFFNKNLPFCEVHRGILEYVLYQNYQQRK
jgi:hypothetical protein